MSIERTFHCDGPDCVRYSRTVHLKPPVFLTVAEQDADDLHFCGWDCLLRHAAGFEPEAIYHPEDL